VWRSLVARFVRDEEVAGSNPVTPTQVRARSRASERALTRLCLTKCLKDQQANLKNHGSKGGQPPVFDREAYKERNTVERCVNKLANTARSPLAMTGELIYQGTIDVASIRIWLPPPSQLITRRP
jgi:transposase